MKILENLFHIIYYGKSCDLNSENMEIEEIMKADKAIILELLRKMLLIRRFEEKIIDVYSVQDMKTPVHLYIGQEAIACGVCVHLKNDDYVFSTHRSHGHCLAKGTPPSILYAEFYGRKSGCAKGKGGSMHLVDTERGIWGTTAIVGGGIPLGIGTALASKMKRDNKVTVVFFGDGAADEGTLQESLNFVSLKKLPVIFVCENNFYATNSHLRARRATDDIIRQAQACSINSLQVNGNNVMDVYNAAKNAVDMARDSGEASFIECKTYRWMEHVGPNYDYIKGCRPQSELDEWIKNCPIEHHKDFTKSMGIITEDDFVDMINIIDAEIETAIAFAKESAFPDTKELFEDVLFNNI